MESKQIVYNDQITRQFIWASIFWGIIGMLVGVYAASEMAFWKMNMNTSWLTFGRIRPLHTNAVIFAFVGNMIFAGTYYSLQRLLKTRLASDVLSKLHFWGWQLIIVGAAVTLPFGITQSKEYAELEWPLDLAVTLIWVVFAVNFFWTLKKRNEKNLYVAIWFYIATIITIAVLYIVNNLSIPLNMVKSYSVFAGVQDALVQWWYGHNAVAFFLTTPILGIMYYFMPKAIGKPVYSYRLSIIHFWALVFLYIWAGPHHLLNTALPDWVQSLGMVFSIALWAPSWGGMINGLLTLRGAWDKLRTDPVVKFFAAAVTFYGMSTLEGPLLSIKAVNSLGHYTDWIIGHVHGGALGWNGFMAAGMFYWLIPRLYGTKLHSQKMANFHFWVGLVGILLYMVAMYISGITQGLMWRGLNPDGTLMYPQFLESILASRNMYILRMFGGLLYLSSFILMAYNLLRTAMSGKAVDGTVSVMVKAEEHSVSWKRLFFSPTIALILVGLGLMLALQTHDLVTSVLVYIGLAVFFVAIVFFAKKKVDRIGGLSWHQALEGKAFLFTVFVLVAILIGGMVQIIPLVTVKEALPLKRLATPYTPLELEGRDIYVSEGCYTCHSQMIRYSVDEYLRYGPPSEAWEFMYDHPFQWGSKRTGPDLQRVGGKYPDLWHLRHLVDPRSTSPGSIMPNYDFMLKKYVDYSKTKDKIQLMISLGVPYTQEDIDQAQSNAEAQAKKIKDSLPDVVAVKKLWESDDEKESTEDKYTNVKVEWNSDLIALIAYLQRLGTDVTKK